MLIQEYYSIDEIIKWELSTLTRRMITLRIKKLKLNYPALITGGNQGKKYKIHYSLIRKITKRTNGSQSPRIKEREEIRNQNVSEIYYWNTKWTYFLMINQEDKELDYKTIIDLIPKSYYSLLFYAGHYSPKKSNENIHLHFLIQSEMGLDEFKKKLKSSIDITTAPITPVRFREDIRKECFSYFKDNREGIYNKPAQHSYYYGVEYGTGKPLPYLPEPCYTPSGGYPPSPKNNPYNI